MSESWRRWIIAPFLCLLARVHQLRIGEERHEPEVHVKLLVTVEECHPRMVSDEVEFRFQEAAHRHHVFHNTGRWLARHTDYLPPGRHTG
jgi:hypothetical protein